jgi:hypothetical protein
MVSRWCFNNSKNDLAGAGTQNAGLAFGGTPHLQYHVQKNMMVHHGPQVVL